MAKLWQRPKLSRELPFKPSHEQSRIRQAVLNSFAVVGIASVLTSIISQRQGWISSTSGHLALIDVYPDTDYPLRNAIEPWDISTSYPYTRNFFKQVSEGTWLRIATHPLRDEIVFDMLGDLYCMSIGDVYNSSRQALPILQGIPYDKEAEFSPDGTTLVFTSDAGFGVDNIWTLPYSTCEDMGAMPTNSQRERAIQQTNSTFRFFTAPAFHPTLPKIVATKWYLTGRPNGAGELWEFPLLTEPAEHLEERAGKRIIGRKLPASWPAERYFQSQIGAEQGRYVGSTGEGILFTRNVRDDDEGIFSENKDVHKGINSIFLYNTTTGITHKLVDATPGGANMPRLSHDGETLAFVRRVKEKSVLVLKSMRSGTIHHAWTELTYDVSLIPAFMGSYPNYGFSSTDESIIIWSSGHIYKVPLKFNELHERVVASPPLLLKFTAEIHLSLAQTRYSETDIRKFELRDEGRVHALRNVRSDWNGQNVAFEAAGDNHLFNLQTGISSPVPKFDSSAEYYAPSFIHRTSFVLQARWSNTNLTNLELVDISTGEQFEVEEIPRGRYLSPIIHGERIAFVRTGKEYLLGDVEETAGEGIWVGDFEFPRLQNKYAVVNNLKLIDPLRAGQDVKLDWRESSARDLYLLVQDSSTVTQYHVGSSNPGQLVATGKTSVEMTLAQVWKKPVASYWHQMLQYISSVPDVPVVAYRDFQHVWIAHVRSLPALGVWTKPGDVDSPQDLIRLSQEGGHDITFSGDGSVVFWLFGPKLFHVPVGKVFQHCAQAPIELRDTSECAASLIESHELQVSYETDLHKLKQQSDGRPVALINATIISMDPAQPDVLEEGAIVYQDGVFSKIGNIEDIRVPENAHVMNLYGAAVLPGYVDVHGHWGGFLTQYPHTSWELETFLGYGVTTIHNPSSKNVGGMIERSLVEKGAIYGPRIYHTGDVLYGSTQPNVYTEINSRSDARNALLRVKVEGGEAAFSVKNYQLTPRSSRQRLLLEAEKLDMLVVPEGGWNIDWDMTYFIDGMTSLEHPVPIPELFDDCLSLIAASGSSYTPIAVMNYGGLYGKLWVHQNNDIPEDTKLRNYVLHDILGTMTEVKQAPDYSYQFFNSSISAKKLVDRGVRVNIGSHGEQPIGFLFHSEMLMTQLGGQTPYEILRAATIGGATSLGLNSSVGSISRGKMADLVIYAPEINNIQKVWENSKDMRYVIRGGRIFSVENGLEEVWPRQGRRQEKPRWNAD